MNENAYQAGIIRKLYELLPGCVILKNDSSYMPGVPDLLILYEKEWAMLEVKLYKDSRRRPNQDYYIDLLGSMSFASFIYPEIEEAVFNDLQDAFRSIREARLFESQ
jgi:hypothetical protein